MPMIFEQPFEFCFDMAGIVLYSICLYEFIRINFVFMFLQKIDSNKCLYKKSTNTKHKAQSWFAQETETASAKTS